MILALQARIVELETPPAPPDPAILPGWGAPVWRDEFDGDLSQWNVRHDWLTMDTANAVRENAFIKDGVLHLLGTWLDVPEERGPKGIITHQTGYLDTRLKVTRNEPNPVHFSQMYGRWEIRCQTPTGANTLGALAAFWLRADNHSGEIDILEAWGGAPIMPKRDEHQRYVSGTGVTTVHSDTMGGGKQFKVRHFESGTPRTVHSEMHVYAFERTPEYMSVTVDGVQVFRVTPLEQPWLWDPRFFGSPLHMRLNLHIGPNETYYGLPDPANRHLTTDPLDFQIDYVRVYALEV